MPRPLSLGFATSPSRSKNGENSLSNSATPSVKKAKSRLSRLLHLKSSESLNQDRLCDTKNEVKQPKSKSLSRRTMAYEPMSGTARESRWQPMPPRRDHDPHKLSMVSERDEPLELIRHMPITRMRGYEPVRPGIGQRSHNEYRPDSARSLVAKPSASNTSKHDSILTDYSDLCAMPNEENEDYREMGSSSPRIHELPSIAFPQIHGRTPSSSAPIPCLVAGTEANRPTSSPKAEVHDETSPVSPIVRTAPENVPQVTAMDVAILPDFSEVPNATRRKHRSDAASVFTFQEYTDVVTDWQAESYRLRKQLKAVELQLRCKADLLASEQKRVSAAEAEVARTKIELQLVRGETQLLRVSNGLKHDETCALKAELGSLQNGDQNRHKELTTKLRTMAERLALEEDAVADKDLRIKWLETEREELERENQVLKNVKGALWGHMEKARKREPPRSPVTIPEGQPSWWI